MIGREVERIISELRGLVEIARKERDQLSGYVKHNAETTHYWRNKFYDCNKEKAS